MVIITSLLSQKEDKALSTWKISFEGSKCLKKLSGHLKLKHFRRKSPKIQNQLYFTEKEKTTFFTPDCFPKSNTAELKRIHLEEHL